MLVARLFSFRQFDGLSLLLLVEKELSRAGLELVAVQFVVCVDPLDSAAPSSAATLWVMRGGQGLVIAAQGTMVCANARTDRTEHNLSRGAIVIRTQYIHKSLHIPVFVTSVFGPDYYVPPQYIFHYSSRISTSRRLSIGGLAVLMFQLNSQERRFSLEDRLDKPVFEP